MKSSWLLRFAISAFFAPLLTQAQTNPPNASTPTACPVEFVHFNPSGVSVKVKNVSGKAIVGLVFYAALADATEHWKWLHWDFDQNRSVREFSWNRTIKKAEIKNLTWERANLDFEHGGGGAFVLTSALFDDGSSWESPSYSAPCRLLWYNHHKKVFLKPIELPPAPVDRSETH